MDWKNKYKKNIIKFTISIKIKYYYKNLVNNNRIRVLKLINKT